MGKLGVGHPSNDGNGELILNAYLENQTAIISGGLGDIGRAIARKLAELGADIALGDIVGSSQSIDFLQDLKKLGRRARYDCVDVTDALAVSEWVAAVETDFGAVTLIVPNAAIVTLSNFRTLRASEWNRELRVNLDGSFHLAQAGVQRLLQLKKEGRVVFIGSWAGHRPHTHIPAYCVAKAGLRMLCQCMALELAPYGILVNEVAPGYVDAGLSGRMFEKDTAARDRFMGQVPIQKLIKPADVALQVAHLFDPQNQHMTGSLVLMDGGLSLA